MKFSVIIPVYNVQDYLEQCVESVLNQDFKDYELILVDDGSPDRCPQICDMYAEKHDHVYVIHKENGGLSDARNFGLKQAKGDYICFLDSDDYWDDESALTKLAVVIDKYDADFIPFGSKRLYQLEGRIVNRKPRDFSMLNELELPLIYQKIIEMGRFSISACLMVSSRKFLIENELFFKKGIKSEDIEWALRLFSLMPKIVLSDDSFYVYRMQREGSITASVDYKHLCDYCNILEDNLPVVLSAPVEIRDALMSYFLYHSLIATAFCFKVSLNHKQKHELLLRLKKIMKGRINKYTLDKRVKLASTFYKFCGFSVMARVLGFYLNNRGH